MRFDELTLEKYGAVSQRTVALGAGNGLVVVYGPNEAGKSTSLAAITDFLFGIPERSPRASVFGGDAIRLTGTLRRADGSVVSLRRRKGRGKTLSDLQGNPLEESNLSSLLGGTSRERFETLFGLDHEGLRRGGAQLLAADGEIGRLIVEAGGGLRSLVQRLERIDREIDGLFSTRKKEDRAFYKALAGFELADRDVKTGSLTFEQYQRAREAHEAAEAQVRSLREEKSALVAESSALERLVRVVPILRSLDLVHDQLAAHAELPPLPDAFDATVARAEAERATAAEALTAAKTRSAALSDRLSSLVLQPALQSLEIEIRDASERSIHVAKSRDDRPNRLTELADSNAQLNALRRRLGVAADENLAPRLPGPSVIESVRSLAAQAQRREPALTAAHARLAELETAVASLAQHVGEAEAKGNGKGTGVTVTELAGLPSALQAIEQRRRQAEGAIKAAEARARVMRFDTIAALRGESFPSPELLRQEMAQRETLQTERLSQISKRADAEASRDSSAAEIERLNSGGGIATDSALLEARQSRSEALVPLRSAHIAGEWPNSATQRAAEVEAADGALNLADQIADRHASEAQRAAELTQAVKQQNSAAASAVAAEKAIKALNEASEQRDAAFSAAFPNAIARFPQLAALGAAIDERAAILHAADEAAATRMAVDADQSGLAVQMELLSLAERACAISPRPDASVGERVRAALSAISEHEEAHTNYRRDRQDLQKSQVDLEAARKTLNGLVEETTVWRTAWESGLIALGISPQTSVDDAAAAAMEWAAAQGVLTAIETTTHRLDRMAQDEAELKDAVVTIGAALELRIPEDPIAGAKMLQERWQEHENLRRQRENLEPDLRAADLTVREQEAALEASEAELGRLAGVAGQDTLDLEQLQDVCARYAARRALRSEEQRLTENLVAAGDALPEAQLRSAWGARDLDILRADLAVAQARSREADAELVPAIEQSVATRAALDAHHLQAGVNTAVAVRETAIAEMHDVVERYVELSLARDLINEAIARVRARQQDPLIARAGELFCAMTRHAYNGVGADIDAKGEPVVVGLSATGTMVGVAEMSDGTRDQLFLAFRLAGVESYCRSAEPLPFVADDILVHFDDPRSEATLEVLADFSATTQVLLFTHHLNVRAAAEGLAGAGKTHIMELR